MTSGESQRLAWMTFMIASSAISVFQSRGDAGREPALIRPFIFDWVASSGVLASFARMLDHSVSDIFLSHARTLATLLFGASKKLG